MLSPAIDLVWRSLPELPPGQQHRGAVIAAARVREISPQTARDYTLRKFPNVHVCSDTAQILLFEIVVPFVEPVWFRFYQRYDRRIPLDKHVHKRCVDALKMATSTISHNIQVTLLLYHPLPTNTHTHTHTRTHLVLVLAPCPCPCPCPCPLLFVLFVFVVLFVLFVLLCFCVCCFVCFVFVCLCVFFNR